MAYKKNNNDNSNKNNIKKNSSLNDLSKWRDFDKILMDMVINPNYEDYRYITYQLYKVSDAIANLETAIAEKKEEVKNKEAELYLQIKKEEIEKIEKELEEEQKIQEKEEQENKDKKKKTKKTAKVKKTLPSKEIEMMVALKLKDERQELLNFEKELKKKKNKYDAVQKILKAVDTSLFYLNSKDVL